MNIIAKFKKWYKGELVVTKNDPSSTLFIVSGGHFKKTPLFNLLNLIVNFWLKHWLVLFPTFVAALVAIYIHLDSKEPTPQKTNQPSLIINVKSINIALTRRSSRRINQICVS